MKIEIYEANIAFEQMTYTYMGHRGTEITAEMR